MSGAPARVDLQIGGMTCASCAARVQKKLNKLPGVSAEVNYATETASVIVDGHVSVDELVAAVEATGYTAALPAIEADDADNPELDSLRRRLIVCTVLTVPVVLLAMVPALQFDYWQWVSLALATPVATWGAWPFYRVAWTNIRHGAVTMDTLISLGVLSAFAWSLYALFFGGAGMPGMTMPFTWMPSRGDPTGHLYLEVAAAVTVLILTGRYLEARAKSRSGAALRTLLTLGAKEVDVLRDGREVRLPIESLSVGDLFVVRPGEKVATDGVVVEGNSAIDASLLTGEPVPIDVGPGDPVVGATQNSSGRLIVEATRVGADTQLAQMARLVREAQSGKAPVQRLADRVAGVFVPIVIGLALLTLAGWLVAGAGAAFAFSAAVAVLIIACPCALGLATPTALLVGTGRAAQLGILVKGPQVLEATRQVDTIVLDKTGTVTTGHMRVIDVLAAPGESRDDVLRMAGAVEGASEHPIARAIAAEAVQQLGPLPPVESFVASAGLGAQGVVDGHAVVAGRPSWLAQEWAAPLTPSAVSEVESSQAQGRTAIAVAWDGAVRGVIVVSDTVKPTSVQAVRDFRGLGLRPILLTGDNAAAATSIAAEVGVDEVIADVLPWDKVATIRELQERGARVAMMGDGVNDAAALAQADLGIAMGTGSDVAIEASDVTLVTGDPRAAADAIALSRRTLRTIKGNLFWAFAYNVAAIPLAMAGLLNPMIAGAAMAFSSVFVVTNSLRLRSFKGRQSTTA